MFLGVIICWAAYTQHREGKVKSEIGKFDLRFRIWLHSSAKHMGKVSFCEERCR